MIGKEDIPSTFVSMDYHHKYLQQLHRLIGFFILIWLISIVDAEELRKVNCDDGEQMAVCDKIPDYSEVALLFYTHGEKKVSTDRNSYGYDIDYEEKIHYRLNLTGIFLSNGKEFNVPISSLNKTYRRSSPYMNYDEPVPWYDIRIIRINDEFGVFYSNNGLQNRTSISSRNGFTCTGTISEYGEMMIKSPVFDWETSSVYFISSSRIKECDKNIVMCVDLESKLIKDPVSLTISQKHRQLFWIERKSTAQFHLYKYDLKNGSSTRIAQDLKSSNWLTIDSIHDRIYWMDVINDIISIISTTFDGLDRDMVLPGIPIPKNSSFAVHDNILYWPDKGKKKLMKCLVTKCDDPTVFKTFYTDDDLDFDYLVLDHHYAAASREIENRLHCSHFRAESDSEHNCYCPNPESRGRTSMPISQNNPLCIDATAVATYENMLYVIGFAKSTLTRNIGTIIRQFNLNISSVSALTYNSIKGTIIVAEMKKQRFYSWLPQGNGEMELIIDNGPGTVEILRFDDLTNNLYWIDPMNHSIVVLNLSTRKKMNVFKGSPSYSPFELLLIPENGYMFVSVLKNNCSVIIERTSMDGLPESRKVIREIPGAYIGDFFLFLFQVPTFHGLYVDRLVPCLFDKRRNQIKIFIDTYSDFVTPFLETIPISDDTLDGIEDVVLINTFVMILQSNKSITLLPFGTWKRTTPLGIPQKSKKIHDGILKIISISKSNADDSYAVECLRNNGGCKANELCLNSENFPSYKCVSLCMEARDDGTDAISCEKTLNSSELSNMSNKTSSFSTLEVCTLIILSSIVGGLFSGTILLYFFWRRFKSVQGTV